MVYSLVCTRSIGVSVCAAMARYIPYRIHIYISLASHSGSHGDADGSLLRMVMILELMFLFVLLQEPRSLLIVIRLQMRTAILCTCIYIQYGKTLVCVCVLGVRTCYVYWYK